MTDRRAIYLAIAFLVGPALPVWGGSEVPPEGPPWKRDFFDARKSALAAGRPIFLYFTKTY